MKKLYLLALTAIIMVGCTGRYPVNKETGFTIIDSCEYIECPVNSGYIYVHHNNCKYCAERRKQELEELVRQIKEKVLSSY